MTKSSLSNSGVISSDCIIAGTGASSIIRGDFAIGAIVALSIIVGGALIGEIDPYAENKLQPKTQEPTIVIWNPPVIEPEVPDVAEAASTKPITEPSPPRMIDVPQPVTDTSFVQPLQPTPPDISNISHAQITIPVGQPVRPSARIFDPAQLDRQPLPVYQARPTYPAEMRREGATGQVIVDFIVDSTGHVLNAYAVSSDRREFEVAAVTAVSKWRFRPGLKTNRPVNTHMQIPIVFSLNGDN